jgi:hypothetical protein
MNGAKKSIATIEAAGPQAHYQGINISNSCEP